MSIRILLAGGHSIGPEVRLLLDSQADLTVVGEARICGEVATLARQLRPDIVVLDMLSPGLDVAESRRRLFADLRGAKVIAIAVKSDGGAVREVLRAGALGYVLQQSVPEELLPAVRAVAQGRPFLSAVIVNALVEEFVRRATIADRPATPSPGEMLTARELEVLRLLADGRRVKEIAHTLRISAKTVESHRQNVMDKLEIHSTVELARYALREGLASI